MLKRATTLYEDTVAALLEDAERKGDESLDLKEVARAVVARAKTITRWEEKKE